MKISQTIPVLPSSNFDQTTQFYALFEFSQVNVCPDYLILESAGIITNPPSARPWGMIELELIDPDGSLLRFGEPLEP